LAAFSGTPGAFPRDDLKFRLNSLQLAAKVHEVLIIGFVSTIELEYVRYLLLRGGAIAFGGVFASFQLTDLSLLWKPPLWAVAFSGGALI